MSKTSEEKLPHRPNLRRCQFSLARLIIASNASGAALAIGLHVAEKQRQESLDTAIANNDVKTIASLIRNGDKLPEQTSHLLRLAMTQASPDAMEFLLKRLPRVPDIELYWDLILKCKDSADWEIAENLFDHAGKPDELFEVLFYLAVSTRNPAKAKIYKPTIFKYQFPEYSMPYRLVREGQLEILTPLIEAKHGGLDYNELVREAIWYNQQNILEMLGAHGAIDLSRVERSQLKRLHQVLFNKPNLLKIYLDNTKQEDRVFKSLIEDAIYVGSNKELKFVLNHPGSASVKDLPWLNTAVLSGNLDKVQFLIDSGADIHYKRDEALRLAIRIENVEMARFLIKLGADPKEAAEHK